MHAPQFIYLALMFFGLFMSIKQHGQPREPMNANTTFASVLLSLSLLYWGGFFSQP